MAGTRGTHMKKTREGRSWLQSDAYETHTQARTSNRTCSVFVRVFFMDRRQAGGRTEGPQTLRADVLRWSVLEQHTELQLTTWASYQKPPVGIFTPLGCHALEQNISHQVAVSAERVLGPTQTMSVSAPPLQLLINTQTLSDASEL